MSSCPQSCPRSKSRQIPTKDWRYPAFLESVDFELSHLGSADLRHSYAMTILVIEFKRNTTPAPGTTLLNQWIINYFSSILLTPNCYFANTIELLQISTDVQDNLQRRLTKCRHRTVLEMKLTTATTENIFQVFETISFIIFSELQLAPTWYLIP